MRLSRLSQTSMYSFFVLSVSVFVSGVWKRERATVIVQHRLDSSFREILFESCARSCMSVFSGS
jgi:hypothetical protein